MITDVAIMFEGEIWSLPAPNRHHDVIRKIYDCNGCGINGPDVQGFLDNEGNFLNRVDALQHIIDCQQILVDNKINGGRLYSENVW